MEWSIQILQFRQTSFKNFNMSENKKENFTFFNEEWNRSDWEDNVDVVDERKKSKLRED